MIYGYFQAQGIPQDQTAIERLRAYGIDMLHIETGRTRKDINAGFNDYLARLRVGDTMVVYSLYNLGRTTKQLTVMASHIYRHGLYFVSLTDDIDTRTHDGSYLLQTLNRLQDINQLILSDRTGQASQCSAGEQTKKGRPQVNKERIDKALSLYYSNQYTIPEILKIVQIGKSTLYKYLDKGSDCK